MRALAALLLAAGGVDFHIADPAITESSGLVDTGSAVYTVNDSGNAPLLYRLDPRSGRTTGTTRLPANVDIEALAPGADGTILVGDIGDNQRERDSIAVYRVAGDLVETLRLRYPDGAHDAETLLVGGDKIYVVTKEVPGTVYAAPSRGVQSGTVTMRRVARVPSWLTDGAVMPDGRHVLLRNYGQVHLLSFPAFDLLASTDLPKQPQGEGISVSPTGRVRISSEGLQQPVRTIRLSPRMRTTMSSTASPSPAASPSPIASPSAANDLMPSDPDQLPSWVIAGGLLGVICVALAIAAAGLRRRSSGHG